MESSHYLILPVLCDPLYGKNHPFLRGRDDGYWQRIEKGFSAAKTLKEKVHKETGLKPKLTWMIKADCHMESFYGDPVWAVKKFEKLWKMALSDGDEVGWIFYPVDKKNGEWSQVLDQGRLSELILRNYEAFKKTLVEPSTTFFGWHGQTQDSIKILEALGLKVDLSAVPGWYTRSHRGGDKKFGLSDWEISPKEPYHPSSFDYRRPIAYQNESALSLLVVPSTLVKNRIRQLNLAIKDLWNTKSLGLRRNIRRRRQGIPIDLRSCSHQLDALLHPAPGSNNRLSSLIIFSDIQNLLSHRLRDNLVLLVKRSRESSSPLKSLTARELWDVWPKPAQIGLDPRRFQFLLKEK